MKRALWTCVVLSLINAMVFPDFITLGYIALLLLLIFIFGKGEIKKTKILMFSISLVVIIISIININIISIITSIILILSVINEVIKENFQNRFDKQMGFDAIFGKTKETPQEYTKYSSDYVDKVFEEFISNYDKTNYMIRQKYQHSKNVANNAKNIALELKLDKKGVYLAYLMGLIHDIGRFEQVKINNTFDDKASLDHGDYGADLLKGGLLRQFIKEDKYDELIYKVVKSHNKIKIDPSYSEEEKLYSSIIRDADKLDILSNLGKEEFKDFYGSVEDLEFSEDILKEIEKKETINKVLVKNNLDVSILRLKMVYDINYEWTLKEIKAKDYLNKYLELIDTTENNMQILKSLVKQIYNDIDNKTI